ncbi:MAG TPA: MFS transporter [Patescibacteria group bacterium]|nr:MFS transporter [Patescibacteria group bacterium]
MKSILKRLLPSSYKDIYEKNMYYFITNGILFTLVVNLYKPFAQKFLYRLGGGETHVSLYNSLPGLIALFGIIPGVIYMCKAVSKKKTLSGIFLFSRFFILLYAFVPFLPMNLQPLSFVIITALMNFPEAVSSTALQSVTADVFGERERAWAITSKNRYTTIANFLSLIVLSQLLNVFGTTNEKTIIIYQVFFVLAFIVGLVEILTFRRLKETTVVPQACIDLKQSVKEVFGNKAYLGFLGCSLTFHFGWQMGWPLFGIYQIEYLLADETWLTILSVTSSIVMFFSFGYWSKIIERKGNNYAAAFATMGMAATPVLYVLSRNLWVLTGSGLIMGFFTAGTTTVLLSYLLQVSPEKNRIMYVAVHATLTNVTLFIAPLIGDIVLKASNIYIALLITALMRFIGSMTFMNRTRLRRVV